MRLAFKTFGCRANSVDTDFLWAEAKRRGFQIVDESDVADGYVINSCTVTEGADRDARNQVRRFKRKNPDSLVAVVGCYGQVGKDELLRTGEIDFVLGTAEKFRVLDLLNSASKAHKNQVLNTTGFLPKTFRGSRRARASIKVQDGCNFRCTFCIIPRARGRSRSLPKETVLSQIREAYRQGYQEVVLTGIHLAHYGWDQNSDLLDLLKQALKPAHGPRIRLSTLDPFEIPDDLVRMVGQEERLCPHFHIALQSGSDEILKSMRRLYVAEEFVEITQKLYAQSSNVFIGADIIVGFPEEHERHFEKTLSCLHHSWWTKLHVFPYSVRKETPAAEMDAQVDPSIITFRSKHLRQLSEMRYQDFMVSQLGKSKNVILEKPLESNPSIWQGHTENYLPTLTYAPQGHPKDIIQTSLLEVQGERIWTDPHHCMEQRRAI